MKKTPGILLILSIAIFSFFSSNSGLCADGEQLVVYYFYGNVRCASCHKIEQYTHDTLTTYFQDQLDAGNVVFTPINTEKPENKHFVQDYNLYTKSVVLSMQNNGTESRAKNLDKVWQYLGNKDKFTAYVKKEISDMIGTIQ